MWIAQISDPHVRSKGVLYKGVVDTNATLAAAVAQINALDPLPDLVLLSGDIVDEGDPDEYAVAAPILAALKPRLLLIPGNHDDRSALRAAFPGGSITGAPKIQAMNAIHALEPVARGPYCGAIAWIGFNGAMDSSVVIRTLIKTGTQLFAQSGGGIVADSDPAQEYEECLTKIRPLLSVLDAGADQ